MKNARSLIAFIATLLIFTAGCARQAFGPPEIVLDRTACSKCRMLISDLSYSAALRNDDGSEKTFDDLGCLVQYVQRSPAKHIWVHDHAGDAWVDASRASFVTAASIHGPMGGDIVAFANNTAAQAFASQHEGHVVAFAELLKKGSIR